MEVVFCARCGQPNRPEAERCVDCGEALSQADRVIRRHLEKGSAAWLSHVRGGAPAIKAREQAASEARMAMFLEMERRREEALAREEAEQRAKDRRLLLAAVGLFAAFLIGLAVYAGLALLGG